MDLQVWAVLAWIATALGGATMATIWIRRGGHRAPGDDVVVTEIDPERWRPTRWSLGMIGTHATLALSGLLLAAVYAGTEFSEGSSWELAPWVLLGWVLVTAGFGLSMYLGGTRRRASVAEGRAERFDVEPAEGAVPHVLAIGHGLAALATTAVLVALIVDTI